MTAIYEHRDHSACTTVIVVEISDKDVMWADFTDFDFALWKDITDGPPSDTPLADRLLGLETLMRRIEEGGAKRRSDR